MTHDTIENKFLTFLRTNWVIIIFIGSLVVTWTNFNSTIAQTQSRLTSLEEHNKAIDLNQNQILTQLSQIQTDLSWIKKNINK